MCVCVTGPGKTGLTYTKYMCLYYGTYLQFCVYYPDSVSFIEFLMDLCKYDEILDVIQITDKKLLQFTVSKSGQILRVDKTCFPRPGHIYIMAIYVPKHCSHSTMSKMIHLLGLTTCWSTSVVRCPRLSGNNFAISIKFALFNLLEELYTIR